MSKYQRREPSTMRLKGFWKDRRGNGQAFLYKFRDYLRSLRYACLRAWNGFDHEDVTEVGFRTIKRLENTMQEFAIGHRAKILAPEVDEAVQNICENLSYYETNRARKELFPGAENYTAEQMAKAYALEDEKIREACVLFGKFYRRLWY